MEFNFDEDLKQDIHRILSIYGIKNTLKKELHESMLDFLVIREKLVSTVRRQVHISPVLEAKLAAHPKKKEILYIAGALDAGTNVNFFQSKRLLQPKFHDHLVYAWGIYHFHLSLKKDSKTGFLEKTNELLFVYVDDHRAILLDTDKHSPGIFADVKWLEILIDHYPDVLAKQKDSTMTVVHPIVSSLERQALWDKGYTLDPTMVRGACYWSKGVGRATSRHSNMMVKNSHAVQRWVYDITQQLNSDGAVICNDLGLPFDSSILKLRFGTTNLEVYEVNSKKVVLQYRNLFQLPR